MIKYLLIALLAAVVLYLLLRGKGPVAAEAEGFIQAPIEQVWAIQTNLQSWPSWNGDVESMDVRGPLVKGTRFVWKAGGLTITSTLADVEPPVRITWTGEAPGIHAVHEWTFAPSGNGTRVHTTEEFTGPLALLLPGTMKKQLDVALRHGVDVLKIAAEREASAVRSAEPDSTDTP